MKNKKQENNLNILRDFLALPHSADAVLDKFSTLPNAIRGIDEDGIGFVYVPSTHPSPVLLVAHADVFIGEENLPELFEDDKIICNPGHILGADDRAGCAIIWALRHLGHGILITDGEEYGCCGAEDIMDYHPELREELQSRY